MFISKENAEKIAHVSYSLFEMGKNDGYITYKKAMEFDKTIGKKVLLRLEEELQIVKLYEEARSLGARLHHADNEIITIDNYQYIENISYEVVKSSHRQILSLDIKMVNTESITVPNLDYFYAPNIYGHMLRSKDNNGDYPRIVDPSMKVVFLKAIIAEDRRINPYVIKEKDVGDKYSFSYCFPMEESLRETLGFEDEINILNDLFKITNGRFFSEGKMGGYADISIKPTVLYLESINEIELATRFRKYDKGEKYQYLNMIIDYAEKGYYGISFSGERKQIKLL